MSQLTKDQVREVAEVINHYAKSLDLEQSMQEERQRQKLIAYLRTPEQRVLHKEK